MFENNSDVAQFIIVTFMSAVVLSATILGAADAIFEPTFELAGFIYGIVFSILAYWAIYSRYLMDVAWSVEEE